MHSYFRFSAAHTKCGECPLTRTMRTHMSVMCSRCSACSGPPTSRGLVFEVAYLVGVKLLSDDENSNHYNYGRHIDDKLALLPKRVRRVIMVNDDF
jgi:hypothetical protein